MDIITLLLAQGYTDTVAKTFAGGLKYQGSKPTVADLPAASESNKGHMYTITANGHEYVSDGKQWIDLSADLDNKADKTYVDQQDALKQDKLTAGENITINGATISAVQPDISGKADKTYVDSQDALKQDKLTAGTNITIENNVISASGALSPEYISLGNYVDGDTGTLTEAQAQVLLASELNYIWLNDMHRLDFRYRDDYNNKATYATCDSSSDGTKTHSIEINLTTREFKVYHKQLQEKLTAGTNITIDGNTISATQPDVSGKADKTYVDTQIATKQDVMTGGTGTLVDNNAVNVCQTDGPAQFNAATVGAPTITDNCIVSGFDASNYLRIEKSFQPLSLDWEIVVKIKLPTWKPNCRFLVTSAVDPVGFAIGTDNTSGKYAIWYCPNGASTVTLKNSNSILAADTWYWIKAQKIGSACNVYSSRTGEFKGEEVLDIEITSGMQKVAQYSSNMQIGAFASWANDFTIDMSNTYVKIGDTLYWQGYSYAYSVAKATSDLYGLVKPDGTTTQVNNGVISVLGLDDKATKTYVDNKVATKQDTLTAGANITIEDNTIGVVTDSVAVEGDSGTLTDEEATLLANQFTCIIRNKVRFNLSKVEWGRGATIATYVSTNENSSDSISVYKKEWNYKHVALQKELTAGDNITITDNVISALPQDANAGDALIYNGEVWQKQSGYGYESKSEDKTEFSWDGDITGKEVVDTCYGKMYKIANPDTFPPEEDFVNEQYEYVNSGVSTTSYWTDDKKPYAIGDVALVGEYVNDSLYVVMAYEDVSISLFECRFTRGVWFSKPNDTTYVTSIKSAPLAVTKIDSKYIPSDTTKQDKLTAGTNITIDENNVISASGSGSSYTAGNGIEITGNAIAVKADSTDTNQTISVSATGVKVNPDLKVSTLTASGTIDANYQNDSALFHVGPVMSGGTISSDKPNAISGKGLICLNLMEGKSLIGVGENSVIVGTGCFATNQSAFACGTNTQATASFSMSSGKNTIASKNSSFAGGLDTRADRDQMFVVGRYNKYNVDKQLFVVGNGTRTEDWGRSNAFTVYEDGNVDVSNNLKAVNLTDGTTTKSMTSIVGLPDSVSTLQTDVGTLQTNVGTLQTNVSTLTTSIGGLKFVTLTQTDYNNLNPKDANTLYFIKKA